MAEQKKIIRKEIRFAVHLPKKDYREDAHYIKEHIYFEDGTSTWHTFLTENYQRPIWVTKPSHRGVTIKRPDGTTIQQGGHRDKKEFEYRTNLIEQKCTQSDINRTVAGLLEVPHLANRPIELRSSPYVYGYDQTSTSIIKLQSLMKNNFVQSPYTVAASDSETDIDTREVLMVSIAFQDKTYTCILKRFLENKGIYDFDKQVRAAIDKYLPQYQGKLQSTFRIFEKEGDLLIDLFRVANEWGPDWLAYWNMNFDIKRFVERAKALGIRESDIFADTSIPRKYRFSRYKEGISSKEKGGKSKPINPSLQWHSLISTSSFYVIDAMCVYRQLRMAKQEEPSYSLDWILQKELGSRKLKFEEAAAYQGEKWHRFMQQNYPIEYIVYHLYDCLGMLELDAKLRDLSHSVPSFASMTDFGKFNSNPKKIVDALFLFGLERGQVVGTTMPIRDKDEEVAEQESLITDEMLEDGETDDEEEEESDNPDDYKGLDLRGWIQLLPQNFLIRDGLNCLADFPEVTTSIRGMVADLDATSAYPTATLVANVSKRTCINEPIRIDGLTEETFREQNLSVCLGGVNSLEYFNVVFQMPALDSPEMEAFLETF